MKKDEIKRLEKLREAFQNARLICDPIQYQLKQQELLYAICHALIEPLEDYEKLEDEKNK